MSLPKTTISTRHVYIYLTTGMYLCTCRTTVDLHEFGFTRGRTKTGGEEGMQSKGYICTCPVVLHRFVDICQQVFGLFFTYDTTCNGGGGGGGGAIAASGVAFHMPWVGGGGGGAAGPHPQCYVST